MPDKARNLILVASGKGGVGKSTVATNLALALSNMGFKTGLLDADVYGPSLPTMLGPVDGVETSDEKRMQPVEKYGIKTMSMGYLVDSNAAMVWRGPMLAGAVTQFVNDVSWGELDYLIFDLPPGTGDVQLTLAQKFQVTGAVLVSTPQSVALADVHRAKAMFDRVRIQTLGLIENMGHFVCPNCGMRHHIFDEGGGGRLAQQLKMTFFGSVPLDTRIRECGDAGKPIVAADPKHPAAEQFLSIAMALDKKVQQVNEEAAAAQKKRGALPIVTH